LANACTKQNACTEQSSGLLILKLVKSDNATYSENNLYRKMKKFCIVEIFFLFE
jgi:hypothetical protein